MTMITLTDIDVRSPEFYRNPYPFYRLLREQDPVHHIAELGVWLVTRHDLVTEVFADQRRFGKTWPEGTAPLDGPRPEEFAALDEIPVDMLDSDPPDHTRLRRLVSKAFTPKAVEQQRPRIAEIVDELIDEMLGKPRFDLVRDFAIPIPVRIIGEILGVPAGDYTRFQNWTVDFVRSFDVTQPQEVKYKGMAAHLKLVEYFDELVRERRVAPGPDLISSLIKVEDEGDKLSRGDLLAMCVLMLFGGYETTFTLISNGTRLLLEHKEQRELLLARPELARQACEELVRYESPVQRIGYIARYDQEFGGKSLRKGDVVLACIGAANRDPAVFEEPDRLALDRSNTKQIAFGRGLHYCIGAPLAVLEAAVAIPRLLERVPRLTILDETLDWAPTSAHRRLQSLTASAG
ncbi:cytochrome P450 [Amycolatopsis umgeniensis]|uniref:Cytochrome P450 n=1 Tax=Amycolatopsis umgeniensis TaxID=336628 RepID=A0A841BER4_9PSEU|nr:cytochrome P450 [Amycolatopsis umgeniensis]MBB5857490.1 cytochrome P450 [Amycolatopsis umgeniensis]